MVKLALTIDKEGLTKLKKHALTNDIGKQSMNYPY